MYVRVDPDEPVTQGDIFDACPIFEMPEEAAKNPLPSPEVWRLRVIVLTQACDLHQSKTNRVLVAVVSNAQAIVSGGVLKESVVRNDVRRGRVYGWYYLPAPPDEIAMSEQVVDLRDLHTVPLNVLQELAVTGDRIARLETPYREHLSQHFAVTYMRIALPEPYGTED